MKRTFLLGRFRSGPVGDADRGHPGLRRQPDRIRSAGSRSPRHRDPAAGKPYHRTDHADHERAVARADSNDRKKEHIQTIIGENEERGGGVGKYGVGQLRSSVSSDLAALGVDASGVDTLTLQQLAQIENVTSSSNSDTVKKGQIAEMMGNEATATGRLGRAAAVGFDQGRPRQDRRRLRERSTSLTLSQIAQIENVMASSESDASKRDQVSTIMGLKRPARRAYRGAGAGWRSRPLRCVQAASRRSSAAAGRRCAASSPSAPARSARYCFSWSVSASMARIEAA